MNNNFANQEPHYKIFSNIFHWLNYLDILYVAYQKTLAFMLLMSEFFGFCRSALRVLFLETR